MYYIYKLCYNGTPFYIGMSINPVKRYMQHCANSGSTCSLFIQEKINDNIYPEIHIINHYHDKYDDMWAEKETIALYLTKGFLINLDHNLDDNILKIKSLKLIPKYNKKTINNYAENARIVFNKYIDDNFLPEPKVNLYNPSIGKSDFIIAKETVLGLNLQESISIEPETIGNFRKYLRDFTKHTDKIFTTKTVDGKLLVIRIK